MGRMFPHLLIWTLRYVDDSLLSVCHQLFPGCQVTFRKRCKNLKEILSRDAKTPGCFRAVVTIRLPRLEKSLGSSA